MIPRHQESQIGFNSSPTMTGPWVYVVRSRGQLCIDIDYMADSSKHLIMKYIGTAAWYEESTQSPPSTPSPPPAAAAETIFGFDTTTTAAAAAAAASTGDSKQWPNDTLTKMTAAAANLLDDVEDHHRCDSSSADAAASDDEDQTFCQFNYSSRTFDIVYGQRQKNDAQTHIDGDDDDKEGGGGGDDQSHPRKILMGKIVRNIVRVIKRRRRSVDWSASSKILLYHDKHWETCLITPHKEAHCARVMGQFYAKNTQDCRETNCRARDNSRKSPRKFCVNRLVYAPQVDRFRGKVGQKRLRLRRYRVHPPPFNRRIINKILARKRLHARPVKC